MSDPYASFPTLSPPPHEAPETAPDVTPEEQEFVCETCGRSFTTAQGVASHRRRAHGIKGKSKATLRARKTATAKNSKPALREDALLKLVFPSGVPTKAETLRRAAAWLREAEELRSSG
jgi:hypothetical protein